MHGFGALNFAGSWVLPFQIENTNHYSKAHMKLFWFYPSIKKAAKTKQNTTHFCLCFVLWIHLRAYRAPLAITPLTPLLAKTPLKPISCHLAQKPAVAHPSTSHTLPLAQVGRPDVTALSSSGKASSFSLILPSIETFYARKRYTNLSRDFTRGWRLCSKTFTKKEESGENLYLKREFKSFIISDTILLPWMLHLFVRLSFFVQNRFFSNLVDCHLKHRSNHIRVTFHPSALYI